MQHIHLSNPYQPNSAPLLQTVYDKSVNDIMERNDRCFSDDMTDKTANLFTSIVYSNILRIEYANDKLRSAVAALREEKTLFRHEIKKHAMDIRKDLATFDSQIATLMNIKGDDHLDYYDQLCTIFFEQFDKLYQPFYFSILQFTTRNELPYGTCMAHLSAAWALIEFAYKMMHYEAQKFALEIPPVRNLPSTFRIGGIMHHMRTIYKAFLAKARADAKGFQNINNDRNVCTARDNLFRVLASPEGINSYLDIADEDLPERPADMPEVNL